MTDNTQAQFESASPQNKLNYGQSVVYASMPNNGPNTSNSGRANTKPEPVILPPSKVTPTTYSQSETDQYYSVHPELRPLPNLVDMNAVKGNEAVYNYTKNVKSQPSQVADVITLSKSGPTNEDSGLVNIYASTETKNGVTTTTTIIPGDEKVYELKGTEKEQLSQLQGLNADARTKLVLAQGILQREHSGGEAVTVGNLPFSRTIDKSLNIKNTFGSASNLVPQLSAADAILTLVPSFGSGIISKGTDVLSKVVFKGARPATDVIAEELKNTKVPNVKTSTGIIGTEESQARSTIPFSKGGTSSTSTNLGGGGTGVTLTPKPSVKSSPSVTGLFEKTENTGKGTTGTFQGDIKEGVSSSTPDLKNTKLEYISHLSGNNKGGLGGGQPNNLGGGGNESKLSSSSLLSTKQEQVLKSFTKQASKSDSLEQKFRSNNESSNNQKQTLVNSAQQQKEKQSGLLLNNTKSDVLTKTTQQQKEKDTSILISKTENELLNRTTQKEKDKSMLMFKQSSVQDLISVQQQKQKQESILVFKQTNETPTKNETTGEPSGNGILISPFDEQKRRIKKLKPRTAKQVNFLGNAPVANVVGLTRRADITYGNKLTAKLTKKDISNTVHKRESGFNLYRKLSKNQKTNISPHPFKQKKSKQDSIYKKLRL